MLGAIDSGPYHYWCWERHQHIDNPYVSSRVLKDHQPWSLDLYRGWCYCFRKLYCLRGSPYITHYGLDADNVQWIDYGCSFGNSDLVWRFPIAFQCVFGLVIIGGMSFLPESPRWLMTRERYEEGEHVLAALRGLEDHDPELHLQKTIILDSIRAAGTLGKSTPYRALLTGGKTQHFRRMMLGASSQFFQQIGACNVIIYYFPKLFQQAIGTSHGLALLLGGVNMIVYSIFATVSWFLIERVGRRKLFFWGTAGQCGSMILIFVCLIPGTPSAAKGAAVGFFTYIASFGATWLPLPWLYPAEINPIKTRAKANAVSTCSNCKFTPSHPIFCRRF